MAWIIFDEVDHHSPAPDFCLPSAGGVSICLRDYREDCSLVLLLLPGRPERAAWPALQGFAARRDEYAAYDAKILGVVPETEGAVLARDGTEGHSLPLLFDPQGKVRKAYRGLMDASLTAGDDLLVFVLDRYNAPYAAWIGKELKDPAVHLEVQSWLAYIGVQCPE